MQYLDDLVDEHREQALVLQPEGGARGSGWAVSEVATVLVKGVLEEEEDRLHELRRLDKEGGELRVALERLEEEVQN